jgi:hypothetical protein
VRKSTDGDWYLEQLSTTKILFLLYVEFLINIGNILFLSWLIQVWLQILPILRWLNQYINQREKNLPETVFQFFFGVILKQNSHISYRTFSSFRTSYIFYPLTVFSTILFSIMTLYTLYYFLTFKQTFFFYSHNSLYSALTNFASFYMKTYMFANSIFSDQIYINYDKSMSTLKCKPLLFHLAS